MLQYIGKLHKSVLSGDKINCRVNNCGQNISFEHMASVEYLFEYIFRYVEFTEEMTVMGVVWGETERLLDLFRESQTRNEVRARNLSQEIDTFHRDRFLWHQQVVRLDQS